MRTRACDENLTLERVRTLLSYDPHEGVFRRLKATGGGRGVGDVMGYVRKTGYTVISLDGYAYMAHRLAWFYTYGRWPSHPIDHINRDRSDNRISNLREVTEAYNVQHSLRVPKSLPIGVRKSGRRFEAVITAFGKRHRLGSFDTAESAGAAYVSAKRRLHHGWIPSDVKEFCDAEV